MAGVADRNVPGADHLCEGFCTLQTCEAWKNYALSIGRVVEVAPGQYQTNIERAWHLLDVRVMQEVTAVLAAGAKTYTRDAWRYRTPEHHLNHAAEHIFDHLLTNSVDENHLANAMCRLMFAYGVWLVTRDNLKPQLVSENVAQ